MIYLLLRTKFLQCDYFVTCDDGFIKTIDRNAAKSENILEGTKLINPVDFLRREMS